MLPDFFGSIPGNITEREPRSEFRVSVGRCPIQKKDTKSESTSSSQALALASSVSLKSLILCRREIHFLIPTR